MISLLKISLPIVLSVGLLSTALAASEQNTDCYLTISELRLEHGCIFTNDGLPCTSWENFASEDNVHTPLNRTSPTHYELANAKYGVHVQADWSGSKARITIRTPSNQVSKILPVVNDDNFASLQTASHNRWTEKGLSYNVDCSFGLTDEVKANDIAENAEMDRLGPAAEWQDASAPTLQEMPIGTILELNRDLEIVPNGNDTLDMFAESSPAMTSVGAFRSLTLPSRFASAELFNAMNVYMSPVHYSKGMKLKLLSIEVDGDYQLYFTTITDANLPTVKDPIVRMQVDGRRSQKNMKIPQFIEMMKPAFDVILPTK